MLISSEIVRYILTVLVAIYIRVTHDRKPYKDEIGDSLYVPISFNSVFLFYFYMILLFLFEKIPSCNTLLNNIIA